MHALDDAHRVLEVGVEQHHRQPCVVVDRQQVGLAQLAADEPGDLAHRRPARSPPRGSISTSVTKFCERSARFSSLVSTKSNVSGVSTVLWQEWIVGHDALSSSASLIL